MAPAAASPCALSDYIDFINKIIQNQFHKCCFPLLRISENNIIGKVGAHEIQNYLHSCGTHGYYEKK